MTQINPYLNFPGTTEEAFNFYKGVFGGEFPMVMRFRDTDQADKLSETEKDKIMHIALPIGTGMLMATDALDSMGHKVTPGTNFHITYSADSREDADQKFAGLSKGGKVSQPMQDMFWGDYFGMCTDKYSIQWMVSWSTR